MVAVLLVPFGQPEKAMLKQQTCLFAAGRGSPKSELRAGGRAEDGGLGWGGLGRSAWPKVGFVLVRLNTSISTVMAFSFDRNATYC